MKKIDIFDISSAAYSAYKKGTFDKFRYREVYKKVSEYISSKYPDANATDLVKTKNGWSCVIRDRDKSRILYITECEGEPSFWEKEI